MLPKVRQMCQSLPSGHPHGIRGVYAPSVPPPRWLESVLPDLMAKQGGISDAREEAEPVAERSRNEPAGRRLWPRRQEAQSADAEAWAQEVALRSRRPVGQNGGCVTRSCSGASVRELAQLLRNMRRERDWSAWRPPNCRRRARPGGQEQVNEGQRRAG